MLDVANSILAANQSDFAKSQELAQSAVSTYNQLLSVRQKSEYGIWRHMFYGDHLSGFEKSRRSARQLAVAAAAAGKQPTLPGITIPQWYAFENY